ncbi:c-type cytochrome [Azohydromonas lata]|uniref:C-type cytochrome n=1 Tax=Azohydromonas lata TaxID=45677 RepID=A0ABU5IL47_9BURK|nr:c-type cytochrome [Azohydromonas lata]MDZ5459632.1 c-type cytochrome [Azohydromonas lata]
MTQRPGVKGRRAAPALLLLLAAALAGVLPAAAWAQPADKDARGRQLAGACAVCHGPRGIGAAPDAPHLAGQPEGYLQRQLRAFRGGERRHEIMSVIAKPLSDADIDALAAFYAAQAIELRDR